MNVTGEWAGQWLSGNGTDGGALSLSLTQDGAMVSGTAGFTGFPCFTGGVVSGVVSENRLDGSLTAGSIRIDVDATVTGNTMNGSYDVVEAGACTGDTGTFSAAR